MDNGVKLFVWRSTGFQLAIFSVSKSCEKQFGLYFFVKSFAL